MEQHKNRLRRRLSKSLLPKQLNTVCQSMTIYGKDSFDVISP